MNAPAGKPETGLESFIERYVAMWNEGDPARRRELIEALWAPDCANFTKSIEVHGHDALEKRVTASWEKWVRDNACVFRPLRHDAHHGAVRFVWEMVGRDDGRLRSVGVEFIRLDAAGRIREDFQFVEA